MALSIPKPVLKEKWITTVLSGAKNSICFPNSHINGHDDHTLFKFIGNLKKDGAIVKEAGKSVLDRSGMEG